MRASKLRLPDSTDANGEIIVLDGMLNGRCQGTAIADAGGTPEPGHMETQGLKIWHQPGGLKVIQHHLGPRCKRCFHMKRGFQSPFYGIAGQKPRPDKP